MKRLRLISTTGALAAFATLATPAGAVGPTLFEIRSNADLVALCSAQPEDANYVAAIHFCHGFGVGFYRYHAALMEGKDFEPLFCLPANMTRTQALNEYVRYSKAHPEYDRETAADVMMKFLVETYPCPTHRTPVKR